MIVEDSRLARKELTTLLADIKEIKIVGEYEDAHAAKDAIEQQKPDIIFLDIQMPGMNGFELLDQLSWRPMVIFTTAYDQYAVRSFEYDAIDYLLKPVDMERLQQAVKKALKHEQDSDVIEPSKLQIDSSVFVKDGDQCWMVELAKVSHFSSMGNYTYVHFEGENPLIHKSLNQLEQRLPSEFFFRANRQQIVNIKLIKNVSMALNGNLELHLDNKVTIEVSRRHTNRFKQLMSF